MKGGAGQYFTPRLLIQAIVAAVAPTPGQTIGDPACGTAGFLLLARDYLVDTYGAEMDRAQLRFLRDHTFHGTDIVDSVVRLAAMNLYLHGVGATESPVRNQDSLLSDPGDRYDVILANPPFGKKSSITVMSEEGQTSKDTLSYERTNFVATTSNKQLNFVQHIYTILKVGAPPPWCCPTTCSSRAGPAKPSAASCCRTATCTRYCACLPASSTPRA